MNEWDGIKAMALPCRQKPWQKKQKKQKLKSEKTEVPDIIIPRQPEIEPVNRGDVQCRALDCTAVQHNKLYKTVFKYDG